MNEPPGAIGQLLRFLRHDLWTAEISSFSGLRRLGIRFLRVAHLVIRGFREDDLPVHAAALTFSTLMSLVPLLAIAFSILKGLGAGQEASARIAESLEGMPEQFQHFVLQMTDIASNTSVSALGWIAVIVFFVTVVQMLGSIENSLNRIWGVRTPRTIWRKFTNYISVTVVVPVLIMAAFTINATLHSETFIVKLGEAAFVYRALLRLSPFATVTVAFFFLIVFMPNTRVNRGPALMSSMIAALIWIVWQKSYIGLQVGVSRYNAIYGTFASVPIFLIWLYVGWMIILLGSEIAFALQNQLTYHMERTAGQASVRARVKVAVAAVLEAVRCFNGGGERFKIARYAEQQKVPVRLLHDVARTMVQGGVLAAVSDDEEVFVLAKAPDRITVQEVVGLVANDGTPPEKLGLAQVDPSVDQLLARYEEAMSQSMGQVTFADLVKPKPET